MSINHSRNSIVTENKSRIIDIFCELLEVSTHLILFVTKVYPLDFFEKKEKYGTSVVMSRHPQLNGYIYDVILSLKQYLEKDLIENIYILIINDKNKPIKRFVYTVKDLLQKNYNRELNIEEIKALFNNFVRRIWVAPMDDLNESDDYSFQYMVKLKGDGETGNPDDNSKFPWILADDEYLTPTQREEEKQVMEGHNNDRNKGKGRMEEEEDDNIDIMYMDDNEDNILSPKITPICSVNNPCIKVQLYVED